LVSRSLGGGFLHDGTTNFRAALPPPARAERSPHGSGAILDDVQTHSPAGRQWFGNANAIVLNGKFDPVAGTARRAAFSPHVEHVGVLYSQATMAEAVAWLDAVWGTPRASPPRFDDKRPQVDISPQYVRAPRDD